MTRRARSHTPFANEAHAGNELAAQLLRIALAHGYNDESDYKTPSDSIQAEVNQGNESLQAIKNQIAAYRAAQEEGYKPTLPDDETTSRWLPETYARRSGRKE